ncbi:IscS subfamily cysteine desulfurase [Flavisolibacter nicotianae]|uniref:IscS subfamily cysteine desulfurase n=1 Tax=Flavisolibacter nicotianae TaxID=2364882 RepID=UPI000EAFCEDD|nr:IscS subfamily cysteine desulfurase [Flavisolibacter nicotianae]
MLHLPLYLDYNATTPCDPRVVEVMLPFFSTQFGNAASRHHSFGWQAEEAVDRAREQVASLIGAEPNEIVFTSGATEADNLALKGVFETYTAKGSHIITCNIEHKAVLDVCKHLEKRGAEITYLPVNAEGLVSPQQVEAAIRPDTVLIAIMYANNELGTIMPVKEIGALARQHNVIFFTDATQAVGKIPVDVNQDNIDLLAMSAHKLYGPKGVGALYVRRRSPRVKLSAQMHGGGHERNMRSGTLNVPGIVGFGKACALCQEELQPDAERLTRLRDRLEKSLLQIDGSFVNGSRQHRLPNVTNIGFKGVDNEGLLLAINKEIAVSSGSACTSASLEPSYVLKALRLDDEAARSSLRFSLGRFTREEEIDYVVKKLGEAVARLRELSFR